MTVERTAGGLAIIASGIHEGDRVVTDGQSRLTPDAPVRIRGASDGGGAGGGRRRRSGAVRRRAPWRRWRRRDGRCRQRQRQAATRGG